MAATKGGWPGFVKNGTTPSGYQQCSAPRDGGKSPSDGAGDAVLAADKSVAPREFGKSGGGVAATRCSRATRVSTRAAFRRAATTAASRARTS